MPNKTKKLDPGKVAKEFNRRASKRKGITKVLSNRFGLNLNEEFDRVCDKLIRKYFRKKNKNVIDIGVGIGRLAKYFSEKSERLVGVDFSEDMLSVADKYLHDKKNVSLIHSDVLNINFLPNYFDLGIISLVLKHNDDERATEVIKQLKKWCKKILIIEHVAGGAEGSDIAVIRDASWYINQFKPMKPVVTQEFKRGEDNMIFYIFE